MTAAEAERRREEKGTFFLEGEVLPKQFEEEILGLEKAWFLFVAFPPLLCWGFYTSKVNRKAAP